MKAPFAHRKIAFLTAAVLASAGASTLMFSGIAPQISGKTADLLALMHDRSPGNRAAGAKSNKHKQVALADAAPAKKRMSRVLPTAVPAATPAAAAPPIAGAALPIPAAIAPLAAVPAALIPAAASSGGFFIPPLVIPGGGGGGIIVPAVNPPPGGGGETPPPVPGVPEPSTWAMMIVGFLFVGGMLRRRRGQALQEEAFVIKPVRLSVRR